MTVLVDSKVFNQMISYKPYTENQLQSKKMKFTLLDSIKDYFSDKWYRFKNGTRSVLDMMAFLSTERGFVYASQLYLGERYEVSDRTIRRVISDLEKAGLIYIVYRRHSKGNSKGKPIYLFTQHPYFKYWVNLLNINDHEYVQEEKRENTDLSKAGACKTVPTYIHQSLKQESNIIYSNIPEQKVVQYVVNRIQDSIKKGKTINYLSSYVNRVVHSLERQAIFHEVMRLEKKKQQEEQEASKRIRSLLKIERKPVIFHNWLD
ncbi:HTH domain-containing protein [Bacillus velezensis]